MQLGRKLAEGYAIDIAEEPEFPEPAPEPAEATSGATSVATSEAPLEPARA